MIAVVLRRREQEPAEFGSVQAAGIRGMDLWAADVLGRVRADAPVDVSEAVEAAHRREPPVDR